MERIPLSHCEKFDSIIFDLGGVILNIDLMAGAKAFGEFIQGDPTQLLKKVVTSPVYLDYEMGKISTAGFRDGIRSLLNLKISDSDFDQAWGKILLDIPEVRIERLLTLKKMNKRVFLLSNTNPLHALQFENMLKEMGYSNAFFDLMDHPYYSHDIGFRKPNVEIYQFVIIREKLIPNQTLFVDDLFENVEAANSVGLVGYHLK